LGFKKKTKEYVRKNSPGSPSNRSLGKVPSLPLYYLFLFEGVEFNSTKIIKIMIANK
jgi:hypothetical protein